MRAMERIIGYLEKTNWDAGAWLVSFSAIVVIRLLVENLLTSLKSKELMAFIGTSLQTLLFFAMSYLLVLLYLRLTTKISLHALASIVLWGQWIIVLPPIIDKLIFGDRSHYSFYLFDSIQGLVQRWFHFFGDNPDFGITYGTRVEVLLVVLLLGFYVYVKKRKIIMAAGVAIGLYTLLFLLGAFPSLVAIVLRSGEVGISHVNSVMVAKEFLTPLRYFNVEIKDLYGPLNYRLNLIYNLVLFGLALLVQFFAGRQKFLSLLKNIRFPQTIFNSGLLLLGLALGSFYFPSNINWNFYSLLAVLNLLLAVFSAWFYSVFINDIYDQKIDLVTNSDRPLTKKVFSVDEYLGISWIVFFFSLSSSLVVGFKFFLLIVAYHGMTYVYSAYPFRLKRFVGVASVLSSVASLLFFVMGFILVSDQAALQQFPWRVVLLLFVGYALAIPLKDIKDIEGDRQDGVYTLPVLLGEEKVRLVLATLILSCYFFSVFVFGEKRLFLPALFCGGLSYWIITNKKIASRTVNWQVLMTAAFYVIILAAIISQTIR